MPSLGRRISIAGLLAVLGLAVGSSEAKAGISVVQTTVMPTPDPMAEYDFKLSLDKSSYLVQGDYITISNVPLYAGDSSFGPLGTHVYVDVNNINYSPGFTITSMAVGNTGLTDITLEITDPNAGIFNNSQTNSLIIGDLYVETTVPYPMGSDLSSLQPLLHPATQITYQSQSNSTMGGMNSDSGPITPALAAPEPSSVTLVGLGLASTWLLARCRRRAASPA